MLTENIPLILYLSEPAQLSLFPQGLGDALELVQNHQESLITDPSWRTFYTKEKPQDSQRPPPRKQSSFPAPPSQQEFKFLSISRRDIY